MGRLEELRQLADTGDPQGCRQLAVTLVRADRISEVEARVAGGDRYARRALADWLVRHGRVDEAIDQMQPLAETGNAGACRRLSRLLAGQGRVEEAIAQLQRLPVPDRTANVSGWLASQGRIDLLRQLAVTGNRAATMELEYTVIRFWRDARLATAVDLLTDIDPGHAYYDNLEKTLVNIASDWRAGRIHLRDEAIDLLGTIAHPVGRRTRAGLLLAQGRYEEAVADLQSLTAGGDHAASEMLDMVLRREQPARELRALDHCAADLRAVTFSPDGTMLATCDGHRTIVVWNLETGDHVHTLRTPGPTSAIAFSNDSTVLAGNGWGGIRIWNAATGEHLRDIGTISHPVEGLAFLADGTLAAGGTLWDTTTGDRLLVLGDGAPDPGEAVVGHNERVVTLAVGSDNQMLATSTMTVDNYWMREWNPTVQLWNPVTGQHVRDLHIERESPVRSFAVSPHGRLLAAVCNTEVWLSDLEGEQVRRLDRGADAVAFHPDGHLLATARRHVWSDAGVRLWNPITGSSVGELDTPADAVAFSPDGIFLATADKSSGLVRLWNITSWQHLRDAL